jgi:hypothetical protein
LLEIQKADETAAAWAVPWASRSVAYLAEQLVLQTAAASVVPSVLTMAANLGVQSVACWDCLMAASWVDETVGS